MKRITKRQREYKQHERETARLIRYQKALQTISRMAECDGSISAVAIKIALDALNEVQQ